MLIRSLPKTSLIYIHTFLFSCNNTVNYFVNFYRSVEQHRLPHRRIQRSRDSWIVKLLTSDFGHTSKRERHCSEEGSYCLVIYIYRGSDYKQNTIAANKVAVACCVANIRKLCFVFLTPIQPPCLWSYPGALYFKGILPKNYSKQWKKPHRNRTINETIT